MLHVHGLKTGSGGLVVDGTTITGAEIAYVDGITPGTVTASKAGVVDANKDLGDFRNLDAVNVDAGSSGVAGTVDVFPTTAASGKVALTAADSGGDFTTTIVNASQAGARTYTIPDAGGSASFVMTAGGQTITGTKIIPDLDAGTNGTAGTVDIYPATATKGKTVLSSGEITGNGTCAIITANQAASRIYTIPDSGADAAFVTTEGTQTINGAKTFGGSIIRTGQEHQLSGPPKVGATAGWTVNAGANLYEATLAAAQTNSTLVVPIIGLKVGWTITAFKVVAQIESAGNTATLDADLRKLTNAAGDPVDASVGTITQVSVTADTAVAQAKTGLSEVVAADEWFYVLITGTTAAATDVRYLGVTVTVSEA